MKSKKSCVKRIHLVTDDGLSDQKAFDTVKIVCCSPSMNDCDFINYYTVNIFTIINFFNCNVSNVKIVKIIENSTSYSTSFVSLSTNFFLHLQSRYSSATLDLSHSHSQLLGF